MSLCFFNPFIVRNLQVEFLQEAQHMPPVKALALLCVSFSKGSFVAFYCAGKAFFGEDDRKRTI